MKFSRILITTSLALSALCMGAQTKEVTVTEDTFVPHFYVQGQIGGQETLGEVGFGDLLSFNAQIGVGYNFNPYLGARFILNSWQSKAGSEYQNKEYNWSWNYVAPSINVTLDLTNLIGGYKVDRKWQTGIFGGIGANLGFNNDEATKRNNELKELGLTKALGNLWDGFKPRFLGQFGAYVDYNINDKLAVGLELQANTLHDGYNSKKAFNADWYFNALVGVKYTIGAKSTKKTTIIPVPVEIVTDTVYVDRIIEKVVDSSATGANAEFKRTEPMRRDVFFKISNTTISNTEMRKVAEIAGYMYANPEAKVHVMGYADKGTGSKRLNLRLSEKRANAVVKALVDTFGISEDRITVDSMDENMKQPYPDPVQNRVAICIAE